MKSKTIHVNNWELEINYEYSPSYRGAREPGTGFPLEPDDEEQVEIISVETRENILELLTDEFICGIETEILAIINEPPDERY